MEGTFNHRFAVLLRTCQGVTRLLRYGTERLFLREANSPPSAPHLCHESVCARVLLILEDNVCVIIRRQFFKTLGVARNFALGSSAGSQGLLGHVGAKLLVGERRELLGRAPLAVPPPRPAALRGRCEEDEEEKEEEDGGAQRGGEREEEGDPHRPYKREGGGRESSPLGETETDLQYLPGSAVPDSIVRDCRNITSENPPKKFISTIVIIISLATPGTMRTPQSFY